MGDPPLSEETTMYIVRWHFQTRFGHLKEVLSILRQWEIDVGQRVGWRASTVRVLEGVLGTPRSTIELETHVESLGDLESSWADMERIPHHAEAMKALEKYVTSGTDAWSVYKQVELFEE
jgi:hypothetical protein